MLAAEMSCPWLDNRAKKDSKKIEKYQPQRREPTKQYPSYKIVQVNVIMDVIMVVQGASCDRGLFSGGCRRLTFSENCTEIRSYY